MNWQEFLNTAKRLDASLAEGDLRSAVSRSYYAVFHSFREWLLQHGLDIGKGGSAHSNLYFGLNNCGEAAVARIAGRIDFLRGDRVDADYDLAYRQQSSDAQSSVSEAEAIVADFQLLLQTIKPQLIADGAKRHLKSIGRIP
jgi:uncharacterized protein (UPF0332 family)